MVVDSILRFSRLDLLDTCIKSGKCFSLRPLVVNVDWQQHGAILVPPLSLDNYTSSTLHDYRSKYVYLKYPTQY